VDTEEIDWYDKGKELARIQDYKGLRVFIKISDEEGRQLQFITSTNKKQIYNTFYHRQILPCLIMCFPHSLLSTTLWERVDGILVWMVVKIRLNYVVASM